ncbi:MAG: haloacid dehalogenase-like hydrolase [Candidatus Omnitrophica bacterium]|nr:haloacid dehalogenase-like hydrolase [Candidatus Omnitrophota bacterium]
MNAPGTQNLIAMVYDFDGTLSPDNMQERTILNAYGLDKEDFWRRARDLVDGRGYERTLAYLKILLYDPAFQKEPLTPELLASLAAEHIRYFNGVEDFFERVNNFLGSIPEATDHGVVIEHYIISSGLKELLEGCSIARYFKKMYACEFEYFGGRPVFPKLVINDTNKTQFLFRINKGMLELSEDINSHMPAEERRVPFRNMIYIGDGTTDIPSMTVVQRSGGHAIAVFDPEAAGGVPSEIRSMVADGRADHFAPADYSEDQLLMKIIKKAIRKIVQEIAYRASSDRSRDWVERNPGVPDPGTGHG